MKVVIIGCVTGLARCGCRRTSHHGRITRQPEAMGGSRSCGDRRQSGRDSLENLVGRRQADGLMSATFDRRRSVPASPHGMGRYIVHSTGQSWRSLVTGACHETVIRISVDGPLPLVEYPGPGRRLRSRGPSRSSNACGHVTPGPGVGAVTSFRTRLEPTSLR
jgi:hypothetical protein